MELTNKNTILYLLVAVFGACIIWFSVSNSVSVQVKFEDIPIEYLHADTNLAEKGLELLEGQETIDLTFEAPRSVIFRLDPEKLRITADLAGISGTGMQNVAWSIKFPEGVSSGDVSILSPSSRSVQVRIGELFRNQVDIRIKLVGTVADGYMAGTPRALPERLELRGQQVDVMQVSYAQVTLNINNATSTIVELLDYTLYDYAGNVVNNENIHPVSDSIQVTLPVQGLKEVPLRVELVETTGARIEALEYEIAPQQYITLTGDADKLAAIDEIVLGTLAVEELRAGESYVFDIPIPEGVESLSSQTTATVNIIAHDFVTQTFEITKFDYENFASDELEVMLMTSSLRVLLQGTSADIAALRVSDIHVTADLSSVASALGSYTVPATVTVDGGRDIGVIGSYQLAVRLEEPELPEFPDFPEEPIDPIDPDEPDEPQEETT